MLVISHAILRQSAKSKDPKRIPCGTPEVSAGNFESADSEQTVCVRSQKYERNQKSTVERATDTSEVS